MAGAYDLLRHALNLSPAQLSEIFRTWNEGDLDSYLIQITAEVLAKQDERTGQPLVDVILDEAAQKGTGKWSSQSALDLGTPTTAIAEAVRARFLNRIKEAYEAHPDLENLLLAPYFKDAIARTQGAWRRVLATAVEAG